MSDEPEEACGTCCDAEEILCPDCDGGAGFEDRWCWKTGTHYTVDLGPCETCEGTGVVPCPDC